MKMAHPLVLEIRPYLASSLRFKPDGANPWVFDDPVHGIVAEPFVFGGENLVTHAARNLEDPARGFRLLFSDRPFPGAECGVYRDALNQDEDGCGAVYGVPGVTFNGEPLIGWLCPTTLKYFGHFPSNIYFKAEEL